MCTDRYKYFFNHGIRDRIELYDRQEDSAEKHNLIGDPELQEETRSMPLALYRWFEGTGGMQVLLKETIKYRFGDFKHQNDY